MVRVLKKKKKKKDGWLSQNKNSYGNNDQTGDKIQFIGHLSKNENKVI